MPEAAGLYYEEHGLPDAPPLILSSGLGGSASYWRPNLPALDADYRVILYDHRGTGRSDRCLPEIVTVDDLADDMIVLLDALGIEKAHVVGHAAGGVAALAMAMKAPERTDKIVVVNGWARADPHFLRCFEARLNLLRHSGVEAFLRAQPIFLYPAGWISVNDERLNAELSHQIADFPGIETMEKRIAALAAFNIDRKLPHLSDRVMVMVAEDDMLVPWPAGATLAWMLGDARLEKISWGGHACNVTNPMLFTTAVRKFLRS